MMPKNRLISGTCAFYRRDLWATSAPAREWEPVECRIVAEPFLCASPLADGCGGATSVRFPNWFRLLNGLLSNWPPEYGVFYLSRKSGTVQRELFDLAPQEVEPWDCSLIRTAISFVRLKLALAENRFSEQLPGL